MTDEDELDRRRCAAREQLKRMFETMDKDYEAHTDTEDPRTDFDEEELAEEIEKLEAELEDEIQ